LAAISRLEQQQRDQQEILSHFLKNGYLSQPSNYSSCNHNLLENTNKNFIPDPSDLDFDKAFRNFIAAYNHLPVEDRPLKVRRLVLTTSSSSVNHLQEFVSICGTQIPSSNSTCDCENCPHKREIDSLLWNDIISTPEDI